MLKGSYFVHVYVQHFASMSGLKSNVDKIVAVWIGSERNSQVKFMPELDINSKPGTFKVLDVMFSTDLHERVPVNFENRLKRLV